MLPGRDGAPAPRRATRRRNRAAAPHPLRRPLLWCTGRDELESAPGEITEMSQGFWDSIAAVLAEAATASTAEELITAVRRGPDQGIGDVGADAFFAGSGGNDQLVEALDDSSSWDIDWIEGDYWWKATAKRDGSVVEYIEGDLYRRDVA